MNIYKNLNYLDNYIIEDYFNLNKKFYPYLCTSAYGLFFIQMMKLTKYQKNLLKINFYNVIFLCFLIKGAYDRNEKYVKIPSTRN
tara:strand:+ start:2930 stop:3184 length:255 start_codon:yes stop_codon:yes gene_type:complete